MRRSGLLAVCVCVVLLAGFFAAVAFADDQFGVTTGNYIVYHAALTGTATPDNNVTGARVDITGAQGLLLNVTVQTYFTNGTVWVEHIHLNMASGALGDDFFIPKNLGVGNEFYDEYQGNITITGQEQMTVAGSQRTVISAYMSPTTYYWDKATGTMVEATSTYTDPPFSMHTTTVSTNIWQPSPQIFGLSFEVFYELVAAVVVIAVVIVASVFLVRKAKR